ncbi:MAG: hypothetical protein IPJ49_27730 [Candidatus Obscuribacter sp.]|nr:hypothetical protein [Candidatus Obscuribacter sp.]
MAEDKRRTSKPSGEISKEFKREISQNKLDNIQLKILRSQTLGLPLCVRLPYSWTTIGQKGCWAVNLPKTAMEAAGRSGQLAAKVLTLFHTWLINGLNPEEWGIS